MKYIKQNSLGSFLSTLLVKEDSRKIVEVESETQGETFDFKTLLFY